VFIRCHGNVFTMLLPNTGHICSLHYSGFQPLCHNIWLCIVFVLNGSSSVELDPMDHGYNDMSVGLTLFVQRVFPRLVTVTYVILLVLILSLPLIRWSICFLISAQAAENAPQQQSSNLPGVSSPILKLSQTHKNIAIVYCLSAYLVWKRLRIPPL
jgi:hypothetical protein